MGDMTDLFPTDVYATRLARAAELCREQGLAGLVIGTGPELAYLTGSWLSSHERLTALVVPVEGRPVLLAPETDIGDLALSALPHLDVLISGWVDGDDAHARAVAVLDDQDFMGRKLIVNGARSEGPHSESGEESAMAESGSSQHN